MEPPKEPVIYSITTLVVDVRERSQEIYSHGSGAEAFFDKISLGWYVRFYGSQEALYFGPTKPNLALGDQVKITFQKVSS